MRGRRTKTGEEQTAKTTTRRKRDTHSDMMILLLLLLLLLLSSGTITRPYVLVRDDDVALDSVFFCVDWRGLSSRRSVFFYHRLCLRDPPKTKTHKKDTHKFLHFYLRRNKKNNEKKNARNERSDKKKEKKKKSTRIREGVSPLARSLSGLCAR